MRRAFALAVGTALSAASLAAPLMLHAAQPQAAYTAPRTSFGQPDLEGNWSNVSLTPETRPAALGAEAVYTPQETAKLEHAADHEAEVANRPTDPNAPPPSVGGDKPEPGTRPEFIAAGGNVGGYNEFWLDPGSRVMRVNGEPRTSVLTTPNGQVPPVKAGVRAGGEYRGGLGSFDNPENRSLGERCILGFGRNAGPPMLANGFYNNDYQLVQTPDSVAIDVEMVHDVRVIRLNASHRTDGARPWMGDSIGHWEGDTLVVETTNIPRAQAYHGSWKNLTVTERFTRTAKDRLRYTFTVNDPTMWDQPWGGEYEFSPLKGQLYEYACHEGNYALRNILAGARAEEVKAGKNAKAAEAASPQTGASAGGR
jgi:hypothetical protein